MSSGLQDALALLAAGLSGAYLLWRGWRRARRFYSASRGEPGTGCGGGCSGGSGKSDKKSSQPVEWVRLPPGES